MRVSTLAQNTLIRQQVQELQGRLVDSQSKIATGKKTTSFSGLRTDASQVLGLRNGLNTVAAYQKTITITETRLEVMQTSLNTVYAAGDEVSRNAFMGVYENPFRTKGLSTVPTDGRTIGRK